MEWFTTAAHQLVFTLLRSAGTIPRHVAFIMDGNRRFAQQEHIDRYAGHAQGCHKFTEVVKWCLELGVRYVTVYAFSLENFKRSDDEVEELMRLAKIEFKRFKENGLVEGYDTRICVLGDIMRTNSKIQSATADLMEQTAKHVSSPVVNVCFAYTSSQDVCRAVDICRTHVKRDVEEMEFKQLLFIEGCPDVDLCRNAKIIFDEVLWPGFSFWHFVSAILSYIQDVDHLTAIDASTQHNKAALVPESEIESEFSLLYHTLQKQRQAWIRKRVSDRT